MVVPKPIDFQKSAKGSYAVSGASSSSRTKPRSIRFRHFRFMAAPQNSDHQTTETAQTRAQESYSIDVVLIIAGAVRHDVLAGRWGK